MLNWILAIPFILIIILFLFLYNFCGSFEDFKDDELNELHSAKQSNTLFIYLIFKKNFFLIKKIHLTQKMTHTH